MKTFIISALEKGINRYFKMDPSAIEKLAELSGKVVLFDVKNLGSFYCLPYETGVKILVEYEGKPDTVVKGTLFSLFKASRAKSQIEAGRSDLEITGDIELGEKISHILRHVDIDWEEQTSKIMGDVAAQKLGNLVRSAKYWINQRTSNLRESFTEYVQEEAGQFPTRAEVEDFIQDVNEFRHAVDRLELRIKIYSDKHKSY